MGVKFARCAYVDPEGLRGYHRCTPTGPGGQSGGKNAGRPEQGAVARNWAAGLDPAALPLIYLRWIAVFGQSAAVIAAWLLYDIALDLPMVSWRSGPRSR